jgi:hypothetical protein
MNVKNSIRTGDGEAFRRLLGEDAARANELIRWGARDCMHFVSDMLFEGTVWKDHELPLIDAPIEAGADLDCHRKREDGGKSE